MEGRQDPAQERNTLIINYPILAAGGIETELAAIMKLYMAKGNRVIWITSKRHLNNIAFEGLLEDPRLEIVLTQARHHFLGNPDISLEKEERVVMITCEPLKYIVSEGIRRKSGTRQFQHYYAIPHFTGNAYFPEGYLKSKWGRGLVYHFWQKVLRRLVEHDCILGFGPKHLECYEAHYGIPICEKEKKLIPFLRYEQAGFDIENTKNRCAERAEKFVITTCARLEFPHKAYMLGLVDSFKIIKEKYPQAVLQIIGYGAGEQELKDRIGALPESVRKDIRLVGMVSPDVLAQYYKGSQLVVGVAGAVVNGAQCGIPSLVARHYCYDCETYGYFGDVPEKTLSAEKGQDIVPFIEDCITMDPETYLKHVEKAHAFLASLEEKSINAFFERFEKAETQCVPMVSRWEAVLGRILYVTANVLRRFEGRKK